MTQRQRAFHARVMRQRADILETVRRDLADRPIGFSCYVRLPAESWTEPMRGLRIRVMKVPEGYRYIEDNPRLFLRKGRTVPRFRLLCRL